MLLGRAIDIAIVSGGLASNAFSRESVGEGGYACLVDPDFVPKGRWRLSLGEYVRRDHILISCGGFIGVVDEALAVVGKQRRVVASTTHFAALPYLLKGSDAIATMPHHAAKAIAMQAGLRLVTSPVDIPRYAVEVGWRTDALRDAAAIQLDRLASDDSSESCTRQGLRFAFEPVTAWAAPRGAGLGQSRPITADQHGRSLSSSSSRA